MIHDLDLLDGEDRIDLTVYGLAETQGSKNAHTANGKAWVTEGSGDKAKRHKAWRASRTGCRVPRIWPCQMAG